MTHKEFKRKAREHQVNFKIHDAEIKVDGTRFQTVDVVNRRTRQTFTREVPNILLEDDCRDDNGYLIFYSGFRKDLTRKADERQKRDPSPSFKRMVTDLLRSEHIPYNIFEPMNQDKEKAKSLFNKILGADRIEEIKNIHIEYKGKNRNGENGLKDGTAFDVFIEYATPSGQRGGIGIEVKYTEKEYQLRKGTKEWNETHDASTGGISLSANYRTPSFNSGWFKEEFIEDVVDLRSAKAGEHVVANRYRQIWRNHILGASMVLDGSLSEFFSLTVYPEGNGHFSPALWRDYEAKLTKEGASTFLHITYEQLFPLIRECFHSGKIHEPDRWTDYLERRYLVK